MLHINDIVYRVAGRMLFDKASAVIPAGHKVGLVGRNGSGKSTLLKLITGEIYPSEGEITLPKRASLGVVAQEAPGGATSLIDTVLAADRVRAELLARAETETDPGEIGEIHMRLSEIGAYAAPSRAAAILAGLGFDEAAQRRPCSDYSGGWRMRVALASALFAEPDLLLLDEPTNYLDLEGSLWLERFLESYPKTLLIVSHDRMFLNKAVDHILHLSDCKLALYSGGYDTFERTRALQQTNLKKAVEKQEAQRKHMQAFVDRFRAKASKARQAQSRLKAIAKLQPIASLAEDKTPEFRFPDPAPLPPPLITMDDVETGYDDGPPILRGLNLRIDQDDRIALLGANGNGKSTLAKLISKRLKHTAGRVKRAPALKIGYFAQHQLDELTPGETAYEHMVAVLPDKTQAQVRAVLGNFGFSYDVMNVKSENLSGGEKARLVFALITRDAPHILVLDEPTNHLDVDSREVLNRALNDFQGAVILISHDRHLVETCADRLWLVAESTVKSYDGDMDEYAELILSRARMAGRADDKDSEPKASRKNARREAAAARAKLAPMRKKVAEIEKQHEKLQWDLKSIEDALNDPDLYNGAGSTEKVADLTKRQADLTRAIKDAEYEWMKALDAYEKAEAAEN